MRSIIVIMAIVWATSCKTVDPMVASGEMLHTVTREVIEVGYTMFELCNDHVLSAKQCDDWTKFAIKFKQSRAVAIAAWRFGVANEDAIQKGKAVDIMLALSAELGEFTRLIVRVAGHEPEMVPRGGDL